MPDTAQDILARARRQPTSAIDSEQDEDEPESAQDILSRARPQNKKEPLFNANAALPAGLTVLGEERQESKDERVAKRKARIAQPRSEQSLFTRLDVDITERFGDASLAVTDFLSRDIDSSSLIMQLAGDTAGLALDFIGEVLIAGGEGVLKITPDDIEKNIADSAKVVGLKLLETDIGQDGLEAAKNGVNDWLNFKEKHPVMARNIESMVNVAALIAPVKARPVNRGAVGNVGRIITRSGQKSEVNARRQFIEKLVLPKQTIKELESQVGRTAEASGLLKQKVIDLTPLQRASAEALARVPGVSSKKTLQGNYNAMAADVTRRARQLESNLGRLGQRGKYDWTDFARQVNDNVMVKLKQNPALVGDAAKSAQRVVEQALRITAKKDKTLLDLLKARRELDDWVLKHKPKAFDEGAASNAMTSAVREVRKEINDFIIERAPNVRVRQSLNQQSAVLRAMDDVAVKAAREADNAVKRAIQNAIKIIPIRNELVASLSLMFGVGGLGAASLFLPFIQKAGFTVGVAYGAKRAIMSPNTRKGIGKLLQVIDKGIKTSTSPSKISALKADRAALLELLKSMEVDDVPKTVTEEGQN